MRDLETMKRMDEEATQRGFTPRTHDTPAQTAGGMVLKSMGFGSALSRSLSDDAELIDRFNRSTEESIKSDEHFIKRFTEAPRPGKEGASKASESAYSSLRSSLGHIPATPDFRIEILEGGRMPTKANPSDAGWDCYAAEDTTIIPGCYTKVRLGFNLQIPEGWEVQIRGRSGLAANQGIISHFGTIDHLYRLELQAMLTLIRNYDEHSEEYNYYRLGKGDKVCQMVFAPVYANRLVQVDSVEPSERGGFGSTGR